MRLPRELDRLPARYSELLDRVLAVLAGDERVKGIWVSGSWARGDGDPASDLDLLLAATDLGYSSLVESARLWWADVTPTVLLETVPHAPNVWYSLTPDGRRLDIAIEKESDLPRSPHRHRLALVDPMGLSALVPPPPPPPGPDPAGFEWRLKELFRVLCLLEVLVAREDWLLGVQGCALMQRGPYPNWLRSSVVGGRSGWRQRPGSRSGTRQRRRADQGSTRRGTEAAQREEPDGRERDRSRQPGRDGRRRRALPHQ